MSRPTPDRRTSALAPFAGRVRLPCWSVRPGCVGSLERAVPAMTVWQVIYSINLGGASPCFCEEETIGGALGLSRSTIRRRLLQLRSVPGLLFELGRGKANASNRFRSHLRWATDPQEIWHVGPTIEACLPQAADEHSLDGDWLERAYVSLSHHVASAKVLARDISLELVGEGYRGSA